ncbi:MAG: acyltransferase [Microthrixaceae bacterium]|nr:acyltransferase [Microthrixaceae bacterium]
MAIQTVVSGRIRNPALTGVRGMAAFVIFLHHAFGYVLEPRSSLDTAIAGLAAPGFAALDWFFVLSGLFIGQILLTDGTSPEALKHYMSRRVLRIVPLYWLVLAVVVIVFPLAVRAFGVDGEWKELADGYRTLWAPYATFANNIVLDAGSTAAEFSLSHFWTVSLELQFYLLAPIVVILARRRVVHVAFGLALAIMAFRLGAAVLGTPHDAMYRQPWFHSDSLFLGMCMGACQISGTSVPWSRIPRKLLIATVPLNLVIAMALASYRPDSGYATPFSLTATSVAGVLVIENVLRPEPTRLHRALKRPFWMWSGDRSYPFYLLHVPVLVAVNLALGEVLVIGAGDTSVRLPHTVLVAAVTFAVTMGLSHVLHVALERPLLRWASSRFRIQKRSTTSASSPLGRSPLEGQAEGIEPLCGLILSDPENRGDRP